jgi:hypothetical protein
MKTKAIILLLLIVLAGILPACSSTSLTPLPHSMKGYELYSWQEEGQWHFTLITGTNRNKTLEEIITGENIEREDGWVNIHVVGVDAVKELLARVPEGDFVIWNTGIAVNPDDPSAWVLVFPPRDIVSEVEAYAVTLGLDFMVTGH